MNYWITKILNFGAAIYDRWAKHNLRKSYQELVELANLRGKEPNFDKLP